MMSNLHHIKLFATGVIILLCSCSKVELEPVPENGVILAFGDSLTAGVGTTKSNSYPAVLASLTNRKVINAGLSGEVTKNGVDRFNQILAESRIDLIILLEGGNDILRNIDPSHTKQNLAAMIETAKRYNIDVVLVGVPEKKLLSNVAPFYEELAEEYQLVFVEDLVSDLLHNPRYKSDSIHFNTAGYRKMAESLYTQLKAHGAF